jgi:hypothetical protein
MSGASLRRRLADLRLAFVGYKLGSEPSWLRVKDVALAQARREESDELLVATIAAEVRRDPGAAGEARDRLAATPPCYEGDRAIRLIDAAISNLPVRPVAPACAELFDQEAKLGWTPLREAFAELVAREPTLGSIAGRLQEQHSQVIDSNADRLEVEHSVRALLRSAEREVAHTVGPQSQQADPLLRSYLPRNIAYTWLRALVGAPPLADLDVSYFARAPRTGAT